MTGPPMHINIEFIASGLVLVVAGLASAAVLFGYAWWAPLVLAGAWLATHGLLRESAVWHDRNTEPVRQAHRHAEYAYRLAVDPPAAKELRLFGLADWVMERFVGQRTAGIEANFVKSVQTFRGFGSGRYIFSSTDGFLSYTQEARLRRVLEGPRPR